MVVIALAVFIAPLLSIGAVESEKGRDWWSLQPPVEQTPPEVRATSWLKSPIDAFILAKLQDKGLSPAPPADKRTLIRRATFDLTGLPPTPGEIQAFLADGSDDAFAKVVDRLLASTAYGERWGRHWLDVVRYADTAGDGSDYPVREAYKYRNYVIDAFNGDKPYDAFLREQLAGDILAKDGPPELYAQRVIATGYLAVGKRFGYNTNNTYKHLDLADTLDVLGKSILGLSIGCARCHDHKYDPISTADYYGLYGIFASSTYTFPGGEEHKKPDGLVPLVPAVERERLDKERLPQFAEIDAKTKELTKERDELNAHLKAPPPADKEAGDIAREQKEMRGQVADLTKKLADLTRAKDALSNHPPYEVAYGVVEGTAGDAEIQLRGDPAKAGAKASRGFPVVLGGQRLPPGCKQSGRLELADWLTAPSNPLTARVIVNRIWQYHFGRGIVATPSDFGTRGALPSHPQLLDWLAMRFVEKASNDKAGYGCGWSIKTMHRLIMLSAVYQMSGADDAAAREADPDDVLLWRFPRRRLEAEAIRDAMLAISGNLDRTMGGEHPFPPVEKWSFSIHNPFYAVYETNRRSVYMMVQRQKRHPFLALFDGADPNVSTDLRIATVTPAQSLFLMNSPFVYEQSSALAKRILNEASDESRRVELAFELTLGREPDADDRERAGLFLISYREKLASGRAASADAETQAWAAYARVLMTSNGFLYLD